MIYVIDASIAIKWFVDEGDRTMAMEIARHEKRLVAPDLLFAEVGNVLRRKVRAGHITDDQAGEAVQTLLKAFSHAVPSAVLLEEAFIVSKQLDHSVYDVLYLICAFRSEDAKLVTADATFFTKAVKAGYGTKILSLDAAYTRLVTGQENDDG